MAETRWTEEQLWAITERGRNLLVAAAAGAGKTAVLVERVIGRIMDEKDPLDIDQMLIVTFTNAAASEMRERIGDALSKALEASPGSKRLLRQITLLNKANITTIHSFCLEVIRENVQYLELDPGFRISDETEATLMKLEAVEELFDDRYEEENVSEDFLRLIECYSGNRDDKALQEMVIALYEFVQSSPWPEIWLREKAESFNLSEGADFGQTLWADIIFENIALELAGLKGSMEDALRTIRLAQGLAPYLDAFEDDLANMVSLQKACESKVWDDLFHCFNTLEFKKLKSCGKDADKEKQKQVYDIRNDVKDQLKNISEKVLTAGSAELVKDLRNLYPLMNCISGLVVELGERYGAKKREKTLLDFNDLEHLCLQILTDGSGPSKTAAYYRDRFEEILVDEYQDSNLVQEAIIGRISGQDGEAPNVFMVGDVKQSIYRFRQAKPELFLEKYLSYPAETGGKSRKIQLFKNFRSREEVISAVNFVFRQVMSKTVGELEYDENEALNLGADYKAPEDGVAVGPVELHIIHLNRVEEEKEAEPGSEDTEETEEGGDRGEEEEPDAIQAEARAVTKRIRELLKKDEDGNSFKVYDKKLKGYRNAEYKDFVILLRTTRNWSEVFVEELGAQGIPVYADSGTGYFKTVEVQVMLSLLQVIDNPVQDIPLLSVLRSPIFGFSTEELMDIRMADRNTPFYEAVRNFASQGDTPASQKTAGFLRKLELWRKKAQTLPTDELIWYLYTDTGYYSYVGILPAGAQRQANLRILFERARQYEETSYKGLFNFINFINKLRSSSGDMGSAKILGENENVVRIMSIHKSKGLEFPVVFLSGCGKAFNLQDMNKSILLHQDIGFGPDYVDPERRLSYPSMPKQAMRYKIKQESLSEEMRILYVAMTRAKEKLILTGKVSNVEKTAGKWLKTGSGAGEKLPGYAMLKARNYLDWIGPAVMRHEQGKLLRDYAGVEEPSVVKYPEEEKSRWEIRVWDRKELLSGIVEAEEKQESLLALVQQMEKEPPAGEWAAEVQRRLGWEYPYKMSSRLPVKISVTELEKRQGMNYGEEYPPLEIYGTRPIKRPAFMEKVKALTAAERGTALHFVMQHLDIRRTSAVEDIKFQIGEMTFKGMISEEQAKAVDEAKLYRFFNTPLGERMKNAPAISRELPFNIELKGSRIYGPTDRNLPEDETILIQGIIDCCFEEEGRWVLLDYKTDYAAPGSMEALKEKHRKQIEYYAYALETLTGKKVKDKYIYLFWNGEILVY